MNNIIIELDWANNDDLDKNLEMENKYKIETFEKMNLKINLLRGIYAHGFNEPSNIQKESIKAIIEEKGNLIIQAQSGTGKTGSFIISALQILNENNNTQIIIITPTRELAKQHYENILSISQYMNISVLLLIGGDFSDYRNSLNSNIIIGTPGKILKSIEIKKIDLTNLKLCVLDEADHLYDEIFSEQMTNIFKNIKCKYVLYSATYSDNFLEYMNKIYNNPYKILIDKCKINLSSIEQTYIDIKNEKIKINELINLYKYNKINCQTLIFFNTTLKIKKIKEEFKKENIEAEEIHSKMEQQQREKILQQFKNGKIKILLSSDLLNRGIDIQNLSLIINYDIPLNKETYIHRIGRCGRFLKSGKIINLVLKQDYKNFDSILKYYNISIKNFT